MRNFSPISALALLAASTAVQAEEQYNMNMPCFNDICWTSWRCYYNRMSKYDGKIGNRCGVPGNVYTPALDGARRNTLVWDEKYYLEWAFDWEQDSRKEEIILEWLMFEAPGTETPISANETGMYPDWRGEGPEKFVVAHSQNISAYTVGCQFQPLVSWFPNEHLNVSAVEVAGYALERNVLRIYHPSTFDPKNATTYDMSDAFHVIRPQEDSMIKRASRNAQRVGNKKLTIGVTVGVAASWFVAFLVSWYTSAWFERRSLAKKGLLLK